MVPNDGSTMSTRDAHEKAVLKDQVILSLLQVMLFYFFCKLFFVFLCFLLCFDLIQTSRFLSQVLTGDSYYHK